MPIVEITMIEGRTPEAKRRLIAKVTDAIEESIAAPRESIRIILREIPALHFGGGREDQGKDRSATRLTGAVGQSVNKTGGYNDRICPWDAARS